MPNPSFLIVGLGNPGAEYEKTRHNVGFMALERLAAYVRAPAWQKKFKGEIAFGTIDGSCCLFMKPLTFMNLSGESVGEAARFYKIPPEKVLVIHDDMDLSPGQVKVKHGGGSAGHNGLKSLDAHLGNDYQRLRIGIGHPADRSEVVSFVLRPFAKTDGLWLQPLFDKIAENVGLLLENKSSLFIQKMYG